MPQTSMFTLPTAAILLVLDNPTHWGIVGRNSPTPLYPYGIIIDCSWWSANLKHGTY